ncbi:MAG: hypothetical protein IKN65_00100 [Clostridia bacterium]|nr:hypothetical protein [Bacilli bacterium]MBR3672684.1 hypothetical protein [Clostridia bacterium]MBR4671611.1 hypothetical protein [Bacilli bacterium]
MPKSELLCFDAKKRVQFIHACYSVAYDRGAFKIDPLIDEYYAVSETAANDFYKLTGYNPKVIYNPVDLDEPRRVLKLISATRIANDKGSIWEKMQKFAKLLIANDIPFIWLVFTNNPQPCTIRGIAFLPSELKISDYIADADYLCQFSKTEGDCLSIKESLKLGTPVLATNFAAAIENGVIDGKTGYIFNMEMDNIDVDKIYNNIPKFKYELKTSKKEWEQLLGPKGKPITKTEQVTVQCIKREGFKDPFTGKLRKYKEKWICDYEDAEYMITYDAPNSFTTGPLVDIIS